jgi:hypothetical protein
MSNLEIINYLKPKRLGSGARTVVGKSPKETNIRNKNYGNYKSRKAADSVEKNYLEKGIEIVKRLVD